VKYKLIYCIMYFDLSVNVRRTCFRNLRKNCQFILNLSPSVRQALLRTYTARNLQINGRTGGRSEGNGHSRDFHNIGIHIWYST
jgi:hypothetical protein